MTPDTPSGTAVGRLPDNVRFTSGSVCFDGIGDNVANQSALSIADSTDDMMHKLKLYVQKKKY